MIKRIKIQARTLPVGEVFTATGQEARTRLLPHTKGIDGVVDYDFEVSELLGGNAIAHEIFIPKTRRSA